MNPTKEPQRPGAAVSKPDRTKRPERDRAGQPTDYDEEVEETFPASDPPASSEPGGGITGPNDRGDSARR
jgi:hypothetical protein